MPAATHFNDPERKTDFYTTLKRPEKDRHVRISTRRLIWTLTSQTGVCMCHELNIVLLYLNDESLYLCFIKFW